MPKRSGVFLLGRVAFGRANAHHHPPEATIAIGRQSAPGRVNDGVRVHS